MNKTMLLGIGGAGCKILKTIHRNTHHQELMSAQYLFADSDEFNLKNYVDDRYSTILLQNNKCFQRNLFNGVKQLIIIAAFGGETGSKYSISAVNTAKEAGVEYILVIGIMPFLFEVMKIISRIVNVIDHFHNDSAINLEIINMERLAEKYYVTDTLEALKLIDMDINCIVEQLTKSINDNISYWNGYRINGNAYDLVYVSKSQGLYAITDILSEEGYNWVVSAHSENCRDAVEKAVAKLPSSLNVITDYLIYISCNNRQLSLKEFTDICLECFAQKVDNKSRIKWRIGKKIKGDDFKVVIIASCKTIQNRDSHSISLSKN